MLDEVYADVLLFAVPKKRVVEDLSADEVPSEPAPKKLKKRAARPQLSSVDEDEAPAVSTAMDVDAPPVCEPEKVGEVGTPSRIGSPELRAAGVGGSYASCDGPEALPTPHSEHFDS